MVRVKGRLSEQECNEALAALEDALYVFGGKWKLRIIAALQKRNLRFNELQRSVKGISARVLSNELKQLEQNGFIDKCADSGASVIEYGLTAYSYTLNDVLDVLIQWGTQHRKKIRLRSTP